MHPQGKIFLFDEMEWVWAAFIIHTFSLSDPKAVLAHLYLAVCQIGVTVRTTRLCSWMVSCCCCRCWCWCGCCSGRFLSRFPFLGFVSVAARSLSLGLTDVGTVVGRGTCSPFSPWCCCSLRTIQSFLGNVSVAQVTVWQMHVACSSCCCSSCSVARVTVRAWSSMRIVQATPNAVHCWPPVGAGHDAVTMTNTTTQHTQGGGGNTTNNKTNSSNAP